jgi:hypothetical protein
MYYICLNTIGMKIKRIYTEEQKLKNEIRRKEYYEKNKDIIKEKRNQYYINNKEKIKKYLINNKEKIRGYQKKWEKENKERINKRKSEYEKNRKLIDPLFKIKKNIKNMVSRSIKRSGNYKKSKTIEIIGCSYEEFKTYLESKFEDWMNWGNYGKYNGNERYGWDIDHVTPLKSAHTEEDIIKLNHYTNLQPLCSKINRDVKKDNIY